MSRIATKPVHSLRGLTLIETLVTLAILSVGLLGLNAFMAQSIALLNESVWHQRALRLTADASELLALLPATALSSNPPVTAGGCDATEICSAAELFATSWTQWRTRVSDILPAGEGRLQQGSAGFGHATEVAVSWHSPRDGLRTLSAPTPPRAATDTP